jgi:hypothetical protein
MKLLLPLDSIIGRHEHSTGRVRGGPKNPVFSGRENPAHARLMGRVGPHFSGRAWAGHPRIL